MAGDTATEFVVECRCPDVGERDVRALDQRAAARPARLTARGRSVRQLGSLLMREDQVVLVPVPRRPGGRRRVAEAARIPYERILEAACSPGPGETERRT